MNCSGGPRPNMVMCMSNTITHVTAMRYTKALPLPDVRIQQALALHMGILVELWPCKKSSNQLHEGRGFGQNGGKPLCGAYFLCCSMCIAFGKNLRFPTAQRKDFCHTHITDGAKSRSPAWIVCIKLKRLQTFKAQRNVADIELVPLCLSGIVSFVLMSPTNHRTWILGVAVVMVMFWCQKHRSWIIWCLKFCSDVTYKPQVMNMRCGLKSAPRPPR